MLRQTRFLSWSTSPPGSTFPGQSLTLNALHTQTGTARRVTEDEHGHFLMIIKGNRPSLLGVVRKALAGPDSGFAASFVGPGGRRATGAASGAASAPPRRRHRLAGRRADPPHTPEPDTRHNRSHNTNAPGHAAGGERRGGRRIAQAEHQLRPGIYGPGNPGVSLNASARTL